MRARPAMGGMRRSIASQGTRASEAAAEAAEASGVEVQVADAFGSRCGAVARDAVAFADATGSHAVYPLGRRVLGNTLSRVDQGGGARADCSRHVSVRIPPRSRRMWVRLTELGLGRTSVPQALEPRFARTPPVEAARCVGGWCGGAAGPGSAQPAQDLELRCRFANWCPWQRCSFNSELCEAKLGPPNFPTSTLKLPETWPHLRHMCFRHTESGESAFLSESPQVLEVVACTLSLARTVLAVCERCASLPVQVLGTCAGRLRGSLERVKPGGGRRTPGSKRLKGWQLPKELAGLGHRKSRFGRGSVPPVPPESGVAVPSRSAGETRDRRLWRRVAPILVKIQVV